MVAVPAPSGARPGTLRLAGRRRYADLGAVVALTAITVVSEARLLRGETAVGLDSLTQFYPWYAFLGEGLREGRIPVWNPHQLSGTPFAADPLSGWTYLPAMILFTFLPPAAAAIGYLLLHVLLAGLATYALARALGLSVFGALLAATAYGQSGFFQLHNVCCFAFASVAAWLPVALLGAELAIRADRSRRVLGWGLAGLALSQILAAWLGQGSYYALLVLGSYVAYRTLVAPPPALAGGARQRVVGLLLHGGAPVLIGFGLAAAGLLPRLEYNALSNLAGGYPESEVGVGGWTIPEWGTLLVPGMWYVGLATPVLALAAPRVARGWAFLPYFASLSLGALVLTGHGPTFLHRALGLLPGFDQLHLHLPERIMTVAYLGIALLAGATLTGLGRRRLGRGARGPLLAALVLAVVLVDLRTAEETALAGYGAGQEVHTLPAIDLLTVYEPTGAGRFLRSLGGGEPFRAFGYAPYVGGLAATQRFDDPAMIALEVNNRAMTTSFQDVQGYSAIHLARYDGYLEAMNGRAQNYHNADVFATGLGSPLLDLLNARYVVAAASPPSGTADPSQLDPRLEEIYRDERVVVLENPAALPRARVVHEARQVESGRALELLASGAVDPRRMVLLEEPPPTLAHPADGAASTASIVDYRADRIALEVSAAAPGLLVLSEVYYPAWKAYVDGRPVPLYVADHALRAVPVPVGDHAVELRYESPNLQIGIVISLATSALVVELALAGCVRRGGRDQGRAGWWR